MFLSETRTYISITNRLRQWTSILHSHWSKPLSLIRPIRRKPKDFCWTKKCRQYQLINYLYLKERILKNCRKSHRWRSQNRRRSQMCSCLGYIMESYILYHHSKSRNYILCLMNWFLISEWVFITFWLYFFGTIYCSYDNYSRTLVDQYLELLMLEVSNIKQCLD